MPASFPASILNLTREPVGTPKRFSQISSRSRIREVLPMESQVGCFRLRDHEPPTAESFRNQGLLQSGLRYLTGAAQTEEQRPLRYAAATYCNCDHWKLEPREPWPQRPHMRADTCARHSEVLFNKGSSPRTRRGASFRPRKRKHRQARFRVGWARRPMSESP
jgi:hypothetical protein